MGLLGVVGAAENVDAWERCSVAQQQQAQRSTRCWGAGTGDSRVVLCTCGAIMHIRTILVLQYAGKLQGVPKACQALMAEPRFE